MESIVFVIFAALIHSGIFSILDVLFSPGQMFSGYRKKLAVLSINLNFSKFSAQEKKAMETILENLKDNPEETEDYIIGVAVDKKLFMFKVLGGCIYCTNIWAGLLTCWVWGIIFGLAWPWWPCIVVLSATFIRLIQVSDR